MPRARLMRVVLLAVAARALLERLQAFLGPQGFMEPRLEVRAVRSGCFVQGALGGYLQTWGSATWLSEH